MMSFRFNHKTDAEINAILNPALLTEGIYPFQLKEISKEISRSGNEMLKVKLAVKAPGNEVRVITDYLMASDKMIFKLKHFCETLGLEDDYKNDCLDLTKCLNKVGEVKLTVQKGSPKPDGSGFFADKNAVKDYVKKKSDKPLVNDIPFNDDITF